MTIDYFQDILNSVTPETILNSEHPSFSDLISLYKRHPEFEKKSINEANVIGFLVKNSGQFNTKCFHAVHMDKSIEDWGYRNAIRSKHKSSFHCFIDAARYSLENKHSHFRDKDFTNKCKVFISVMGRDETSELKDWISPPSKLQYRSSLIEPVKTQFLNWYEENYTLTS